MIAALFGAFVAGAADCSVDGPLDAPFAVRAPEEPGAAGLVLVFRVDVLDPPALDALLALLEERGIRAALSVRSDAPVHLGRLEEAREAGHEPVVRIPAAEVHASPSRGPALLRKHLKTVRRSLGRVRAAEVGLGNKGREMVLHRVGLRTILETNGPPTAVPRRQLRMEGRLENGVVLPVGPYDPACGAPPPHPFTPVAADRVARALHGARDGAVGVVRLTLEPRDEADLRVLARWLDEVVLPGDVRLWTPSEAHRRALEVLQKGRSDLRPTTGGRRVALDAVEALARVLVEARSIPRRLPGGFNPTEAFLALALVVAGEVEGDGVRLRAMEGPPLLADPQPEPLELPRREVELLARALIADRPAVVPPALPVGGRVVGAPQVLQLLAAAVLGEDPCRAEAIAVPEPNTPGLGWGRAD